MSKPEKEIIPFLKRPLLLSAVVCVFIVCIVMSADIGNCVVVAIAFSAVAAAVCITAAVRTHRAEYIIIALIVSALTLESAYVRVWGIEKRSEDFLDEMGVSENSEDDGVSVDYRGVVTEVSPGNNYAYYKVRLSSPVDVNARLSCYGSRGVGLGDVIEGKAIVHRPEEINSNGIYEKRLLKADEIFITLEADGTVNVADRAEKRGISLFRDRVKRNLLRYCGSADDLTPYYTAVGMFIGDKAAVPQEIKNDFRRCGMSHILSVSGLHLSVLVFLIGYVLIKIKTPRLARCAILMTFMFAYAAFTGFGLPVLRSMIMAFSVNIGVFLGRKNDPLTSLATAAIAVIAISPYSVFDTGAALSFLSTAGIICCAPLYERLCLKGNPIVRLVGFCVSTALTTVAAVSFSLPILIYIFGEISVVSVIANIVVSLPVNLVLTLVFVISLLSFVPIAPFQALCSILGLLVKLSASFVVDFSHTLASHRFSAVGTWDNNLAFVVASAGVVVLCLVISAFLPKRAMVIPALFASALYILSLAVFIPSAVIDFGREAAFVAYDKSGGYLSLRSEGEYACVSTGAKDVNHSSKRTDICDRYYGKNTYIVAVRGDFDALRELRCIENFDRRYGIEHILLPKSAIPESENEYSLLEERLIVAGYPVEYYSGGRVVFGSFTVRFYPKADGYEADVMTEKGEVLKFLSYDRYRTDETASVSDDTPVFVFSSKKMTKDFGGVISSGKENVYVMNLDTEYGIRLDKNKPITIYCED